MVREHTLHDLSLFRVIDSSFIVQHVVYLSNHFPWSRAEYTFMCMFYVEYSINVNQVKLVDGVAQSHIFTKSLPVSSIFETGPYKDRLDPLTFFYHLQAMNLDIVSDLWKLESFVIELHTHKAQESKKLKRGSGQTELEKPLADCCLTITWRATV